MSKRGYKRNKHTQKSCTLCTRQTAKKYVILKKSGFFQEAFTPQHIPWKSSKKTDFRGQKTDFRGQKTDFCGQKTDFRGQKTDFRGQKTDFRGQKTDFRVSKIRPFYITK
jgi:hypothetical protein